jgi:predicted dehydrogenase
MASGGIQYGVGIVGIDHWYAGIGAADGLQRSKRARVVAVAHRDEEKLREFAAERGIPNVTTDYHAISGMDGVDLVVTACTTAENVDLCIEAARRGKHIVSVKPFAMSLADADRLIQVVRETGVLFASFDAGYRLNGQWQQYKQWIGDGRIGTPVSATLIQRANLEGASMDWPGRRNDRTWWRDPSKVPGGGWIDHAIYQVDGLRWLLDDEVARVSGVAKTLVHPELPQELEDFGVALIEFRKGTVATIEVTWTAPARGGLSQTHIVGTEGQIVLEPTITGKLSLSGGFDSPTGQGWTTVAPISSRGGGGAVEHVLECIATGKRPAATVDDARANLAVCLAFYAAARSGRAVSL